MPLCCHPVVFPWPPPIPFTRCRQNQYLPRHPLSRVPRLPSVLTCPSEAAKNGSGAPGASTGPGRASHRRGSAGAMPFPGPGARQHGFPARQGEPAPFYYGRRETSPSPRLGPPPPCPTQGRRGARPSRGTLAAPPCAQPSSRLFIVPRPGWARLAHSCWEKRRSQTHTALGTSIRGSRGSPGTRGEGEKQGARWELLRRVLTQSALPCSDGDGFFRLEKRVGARFALLQAGWSFLWQCLGTRVQAAAGSAPPASPELQARLQLERRCHALPPLRWLPAARLPRAAGVLQPERRNCSPPAWRACGGRARMGKLWGAWW